VARLVPLLLAAGQLEAALAHARRAVAADPLSEGATQQLMQGLAAAGAPSQARRIYQSLQERLQGVGGAPPPAPQSYAAGLRSTQPLTLPAIRTTKDEGERATGEARSAESDERHGAAAKGDTAKDKPGAPSPLAPFAPASFDLPPSDRLRGHE